MTGACALILLAAPAAAHSQSHADLGAQLAHHVKTLKKDRQVIRFFASHRWLLTDPRFEREARRQLAAHRASLNASTRTLAATSKALRRKTRTRRLAVLAQASPSVVICKVFGSYCREALAVSRCESGLQTGAQNGQYLGLFQMGSTERRLFGHGPSALQQVQAAYHYFVVSGRDWSPWSCKP